MASTRMDLEARLRALRAPQGGDSSARGLPLTSPSAAPPAAAVPTFPVAPVDVVTWPEAPVAAGLPWPDAPTVKPRRSSSGVLGEVMVIPRRSLVSTQSSSSRRFQPPQPQSQPQSQQQQSKQLPQPAADTEPGVSIASLLGPAYSEAVQIAQQAIESERNRHAHTAINLYIRAGQQLISIGRQQHTAHLQTIVRKKALALLERAEGLSDWVSSVQAVDSSEEAIDAAFAGAQREREQALTEKEALVAKMKSENSEMSQKLNQLVLLTKVRARFRRMVSERRARKVEEALRSASLEDNNSDNTNGVEGDNEPQDDEQEAQQRRSSFSSSTSSRSSSSGHFTKQTPQEREAQKRDLVNELHSRIGLPEISTLRKFTPLSSDAMKDIRHVELEDELEAARLEAERLRAAVQEMEECFQATLEQTRQQSLKLTQEKEQNLAQMEDELLRVRSELERERRLTASSFGGSNRSNQSTNDDGEGDQDSYEDVAMIRSLRSSLHALEQNPETARKATMASQDSSTENGQPGGQRTSPAFKRSWSTSESEDDSDVDEDGASLYCALLSVAQRSSWRSGLLMDNYVKIKLLGEGSFGKVFLMREKQVGGRLVCVKEIHSIHTPEASSSNATPSAAASAVPVMEVQLMKKLSHPNLIRFLTSFPKAPTGHTNRRKSCIVMEFCSGGDLRAYLTKHRHESGSGGKARHLHPQQLTEDLIWFWFVQLCLGLHHMHQLQILHRDVKTSNVFLSNAGFLVLGDFGIARELAGPHEMASTVIGTPLYMAPETLEGKPYSFASDIWALGCVLYELCTDDPPFIAKSTPALIHKICESKFAPLSRTRFSSRLQELVAAMLSVDVRNRPTAASILKDPGMHAHLKRYFHDRFSISIDSNKAKQQQEEQGVLSKQLQSLGVTVTVRPTSDVVLSLKQTNQGHGGGDPDAKGSDKEKYETKLMAERVHERRQQLLVALDKLQRLRLQEELAGASDNKNDLKAQVIEDEHSGGGAGAQRASLVFPQFRRASKDVESEVRWKDPVQDCPRSSSGRDHEKHRKAPRKTNSSASAALASFIGIPRKGVPLTTQAKEFASRSPICRDVRVLHKQERAKAADKYKAGLAAIKPLRVQPAAVAGPQQQPSRAQGVQRPFAEEQADDDAILHSIHELQEVLGVMHW